MRLAPRLYVRIHKDSILVRNVDSGAFLQEPPLAAIAAGPKRTVTAVGQEAAALRGRPGIEVVNPFAHPRTPLSDYTLAEVVIAMFVKKLTSGSFLSLSPVIVMHLAGELEGGVTQIEGRALLELGMGAGAGRSYGWIGPDLTDQQVRELKFPPTGKQVE